MQLHKNNDYFTKKQKQIQFTNKKKNKKHNKDEIRKPREYKLLKPKNFIIQS